MTFLILFSVISQTIDVTSKVNNNLEVWGWKDTVITRVDTTVTKTVVDTLSVEDNLSLSVQWLYLSGLFETLYLNGDIYVKKSISFDAPAVLVTLGDFYETFGSGIMLSMEPQPLKGYDRRINGFKAKEKLGWIELSEIYGTPWVIDRSQQKYSIVRIGQADTTDKLLGVNLSVPVPLMNTNFGLRGLGLRKQQEITGGAFKKQYKTFAGWQVKSSTSWMELDVEGAKKMVYDTTEDVAGNGLYCNTKYYIGSYIAGLQFIKYNNFGNYLYHQLPTLNENEYSINEGMGEIGYQLSLQKSIGDFLGTISNSIISVSNDTGDTEGNGMLEWFPYVPYVSPLDFSWEKKKILEMCFLGEYQDFTGSLKLLKMGDRVDAHYKNRSEIRGEVEGDIQSVKTHLSLIKNQGTPLFSNIDRDHIMDIVFYDAEIGVDVLIREGIMAYSTYMYRYAKDSLELAKVQETETSDGNYWYGVGIRVELISKIMGEFWYGKQRGGLVCSGGVCRWVRPFEGFKVKLNITF